MNSDLPEPNLGTDQPPVTPIRPPVKKKLQLVIRLEEEREPVKFPVNDTITTIGRLKDNDVVIPVNYISAHHAQIQRLHTGEYQLRDLGSQNGTSVNGKKIRKERIDAGDILVLGILGIIVEEADPSMAASTSPTEPVKTMGENTSLRSEYNELLLERERLRKEREELRSSIDRLKEERENPNERQTEPVPKEGAAPGPKPTPAPAVPQPLKPPSLQVSPGVNKPGPPSAAPAPKPPAGIPNPLAARPTPPPGPVPVPSPPVPTPGAVRPTGSLPEPPPVTMVPPAPPAPVGAESAPADDAKIEELHDEMASIDSRRIMIHSNVRRLENEIEGADAGAGADAEQHKQEIQGMKSELTEKEEQLESFLSRLNTSQVEPEEFEDTTEEFKEILVDFDQLCSDLENKVQRLEGELKAKKVTTSESGS